MADFFLTKVKMNMVLQCIFACITFLVCSVVTNGELYSRESKQLPTIYVDKSNHSSHSSIQDAIDFVPSGNTNWICIDIKAGVYNEQVNIPRNKPFIYLKGEGIGKTNVMYDANETMLTSATFTSLADNIVVSGITFVNSYNYPPIENKNPVKPAVALRISGDKSAFYNCSFLGFQDTLLDDKGRHYFMLCTIEGATDFIFGNGQSIYENCTISLNQKPGSTGYIAAQAREDPNTSSGFVFKMCNVTGKGKTFLGRAWKSHSRVIYYNSFFSDIVIPQGWDSWNFVGHEKNITFAEEQCYGSGSNKLNRVKWEKSLSLDELQTFTTISYIDTEGWIAKLPQH